MADEPEVEVDEPEAAPPAVKSNRGLLIAFVGIIVVAETAMFLFFVPSAEQVSAMAEAKLIKSVQEGADEAQQQVDVENKPIEFELGMFGETFSPIDTERTFRVELTLFGLIRTKNQELMQKEFDEKNGRLRHAIRMKIRNSELAELQENQLGLLERRILTTCNHLLEDDLLLAVGFNHYELIEQ